MKNSLYNIFSIIRKWLPIVIFRTFIFLICTTIFAFSTIKSFSQQKILIDHDQWVTIDQAFKIIKKKTKYRFIYPKEAFKDLPKMQLKKGEVDLQELLEKGLASSDMSFKITENNILIKKNIPISDNEEEQEIVINGVVIDTNNQPLPGASIVEKGTKTGTITDSNGKFTLTITNQNTVLVASYIGFETQEVTLSSTEEVKIILKEKAGALNEVIVTALGIKTEKKTLTYAAQDIKSKELTDVKDSNVANNLSGKIAGLQVNRSSSGIGGSVKVTIRGNSSITNNQPLYVIDGVPMQNPIPSQPNRTFGELDGGNKDGGDAISLINPDDIESITVLKGASAAALYGSQGANGVILITKKKGKEGTTSVTLSSNTTFENVISLPKFQTKYTAAAGETQSWGSPGSVSEHVDGFFNTGISQITSVSLSGGTKKAQTYFSYANTSVEGVIPTNSLSRHNLSLRESASFFNDKLTVDANVNFSLQDFKNKPVNALYFNPLTGVYLFPRGNNFNTYKTKFEEFDENRNLMSQTWVTPTSDIIQNPYWVLNRNQSTNTNRRVYTSLSFNYKVNDWLSFRSRLNYDLLFNEYNLKAYATSNTTLVQSNGRYIVSKGENVQQYADILGLVNKQFDDIEIIATLGSSITNSRAGDTDTIDSGISGGLKYANWFTIGNLNSTSEIKQTLGSSQEVQSVFGNVKVGYKGFIYADVSGRTDWSSTLVNTDQLSFFYPSFGLTTILDELVDLPKTIDLAKVRLSYAIVGNALPAFITSPLNQINLGNVVPPVVGARPGESLKPEQQNSFELGVDLRMYRDRLNFAFTYYNTNTTNQYVTSPAPPTNPFGYTNYALNAGEIQNTGYEISLGGTPISINNFKWDVALNFASNQNIVNSLPSELGGQVVLTSAEVNNYSFILKEGEAFGLILGQELLRNDKGQLVLDANDKLQTKKGLSVVGNPNPDFTLGMNNSFEYKRLRLKVHIDGRFGGSVMSMTQAMLDEYGVSQATADARDAGGVSINAVKADGTPFTGLYDANEYYAFVGGRAGATAEYVYSATNINLRELSLGYSFDLSKFKFIQSASLSIVARNLLFLYKEAPFDPNISSSTGEGLQGVDIFGLPTTRSIGFNINIRI